MRAVVHAIFSVVEGGIQWRMLPHEYPTWPRVSWYFSQGRASGDWQRMHDTWRAQGRQQAGRHKHPTAGARDSQSVKTPELGGERGDDSGKKVKGRQRHLLVDTLGVLMAVIVTAAAVSDPAGARLLCARLGGACKKLRLIGVDGTYRGQLVEWVAQHRRFVLRVTLRPEGTKGFVLLPRRWVVERTLV
jgi:putative transposase